MRVAASTFTALGFIAGIAFVVACPDRAIDSDGAGTTGGGDTTFADTTFGIGTATASHDVPSSGCVQWEVQIMTVATDTPTVVEAGWEPVGGGDTKVVLRRCM